MSDAPLTTSTVMRLLDEQERASARFYQGLAERFPAQHALWSRCASVCAKNQVQVARSFQETISDALEVGYAFSDLLLAELTVPAASAPNDLAGAVGLAQTLEEQAARYYEQLADSAESLLATIPRTLRRAAENRRRNAANIGALQG